MTYATVLDIVLACRRTARFVAGCDAATFLADEEKHWAVVSQLAIMGEAVRRLSTAFKDARPAIPWRPIAGMRDRLVHGYDKSTGRSSGARRLRMCLAFWPSWSRRCRRNRLIRKSASFVEARRRRGSWTRHVLP
jgi:uncharacterized protein with HEPN domain